MSLTLMYDQQLGAGPKRVDYPLLQQLLGSLCEVGSVGPNFSFSEAPPTAQEDGEMVYMLYGKQKPLGRGFCLFVSQDQNLLRFVTPLPTTGHDLDDVFAAAEQMGYYLGLQEFLTEERQSFPVEGTAIFREEMKSDNCMMIKDFADERPGFAVSGVKFPLHMTEAFCLQLAGLDLIASERAFSECLAQKQQPNYYYLNPNYYRNTDTGEAIAVYALSEGVDSIIPKQPFIPYGAGPFGESTIDSWKVALIQNGELAEVLGTVPYTEFLDALTEEEKEEFDDVHYLLHGLPLQRLQELAAGGKMSL
ncbi:DUF4299 domain-containing protein [Ruminococcaceae bacterium OttesenSCG-928-I18]|nr:DUF4299 domain-containing protein [Ruminococcaceae bacterium OttesenSCG-928-I18]